LFCLVQLCADSWALGSKPLNSSHTKHVSYWLQVKSPAAQECWRGAAGQSSEGEATFFGTEASETPVRGRRAYAEELLQAFVELIIKVLHPLTVLKVSPLQVVGAALREGVQQGVSTLEAEPSSP
jgi:hypothetical protein